MFKAYRKLDKLQPEMRKRVEAFEVKCKEAGLKVLITETWRSKARQLWLYAKGRYINKRTEINYLGYDDPKIYSKPGERKVTWTLKSEHLTGNAIDVCFKLGNGITYSGDWEKLFDIAESVGPIPKHIKKQISENEAILKKRMNKAWKELDEANAVKKYLANLKGVKYTPYTIS